MNWPDISEVEFPADYTEVQKESFESQQDAEDFYTSLIDQYGTDYDSPDGIPSESLREKVIRYAQLVAGVVRYIVLRIQYALSGWPA